MKHIRRWVLAMIAALVCTIAMGVTLTQGLFAYYLVAIPIALWLYDLATEWLIARNLKSAK